MRICHISDTHVSTSSDFKKDLLLKLIDKINHSNFDLLIHAGDVTNSGKLEEYIEARKFLDKIEIPHIEIPGNHDVRNVGLSLFEDYIGPSNGIEEFDNAIIIYVNSAVPDTNDGRVGNVKFEMMKDGLNQYQDKPIKVVAIHHHTIPVPKAGRERNVLSNAGDILDLFLKYDVDLVLSGHRHYPNVHKVENTLFINSGTISSTKTRYGDVNSYNIVEIDEKKRKVITNRVNGKKEINQFPRYEKRIFSDFGKHVFRIVQISNTFISISYIFLKKHFINALNKINKLNPDIIVHCGGIVKEGVLRDYRLAKARLLKLEKPIIFTPAGRDINYLGYHLFKEHFGTFDQSHSNDDVIIQGISSAQYDSPIGNIGETERRAFIEDIKKRKKKFKGIFLHHNIIPIPHSREKGLLEDSGDLLRELVDAKIDLVMTGTSSHPNAVRVGETVVVNANSLSSIYQRSIFGNSFNLIDVYEKAVAVSEINSLWGTRRLLGIWGRSSNTDKFLNYD